MQILKTVLESTRPKYTDQLHINGSFLWISDFEIPYHDSGFLNKVFTLAKAWQINQVVWGGDALHLEAFSPFQPELNADEEISQIDEYLPGFLEPFEKVYWFVGNHDERLARRLSDVGISVKSTTALRMAISPDVAHLFNSKVTISEYRYMKAGTDWLLEHPKNASVVPGRVAQQLSSKFHCNTLVGHTHNQGKAMFNGYQTLESGHCLDSDRLAYVSKIHNTRPMMAQGAVLMVWNDQTKAYTAIDITPKNIQFYLELCQPLQASPVSLSKKNARPALIQPKK